ncbi:LAG1-DNAbind-domain-containing protein [Tilletiaria anomala UBC 951]|uniref:LAG1-DNAbind-domain-containing protein n=1 Tax=Tilletiaria anomala (strain ATCC 24038 / CBS 436.72 / UBC 951) TaxID=1037660 RepID=A0A066V9L3_TILAU|nr:LAG1-DNAbind-domain-containing protein [Tilletiaria anomala UBC 951]KDN36978.1 LAG1-DNAbind-domain-containing protein [Tilletiaria anomala UBC 951]
MLPSPWEKSLGWVSGDKPQAGTDPSYLHRLGDCPFPGDAEVGNDNGSAAALFASAPFHSNPGPNFSSMGMLGTRSMSDMSVNNSASQNYAKQHYGNHDDMIATPTLNQHRFDDSRLQVVDPFSEPMANRQHLDPQAALRQSDLSHLHQSQLASNSLKHAQSPAHLSHPNPLPHHDVDSDHQHQEKLQQQQRRQPPPQDSYAHPQATSQSPLLSLSQEPTDPIQTQSLFQYGSSMSSPPSSQGTHELESFGQLARHGSIQSTSTARFDAQDKDSSMERPVEGSLVDGANLHHANAEEFSSQMQQDEWLQRQEVSPLQDFQRISSSYSRRFELQGRTSGDHYLLPGLTEQEGQVPQQEHAPTVAAISDVGLENTTPQAPSRNMPAPLQMAPPSPSLRLLYDPSRSLTDLRITCGLSTDATMVSEDPMSPQPLQISMPMLHLHGLGSREFASPDSGTSSALSSALDFSDQEHFPMSASYRTGVPNGHVSASTASRPMSRTGSAGVMSSISYASSGSSASDGPQMQRTRPRSHTTIAGPIATSRHPPLLRALARSSSSLNLSSDAQRAPILEVPAPVLRLHQSPRHSGIPKSCFVTPGAPAEDSPGDLRIELPPAQPAVTNHDTWCMSQNWAAPSRTWPATPSLTDSQASILSAASNRNNDMYDSRLTDAKLSAALQAGATLQAHASPRGSDRSTTTPTIPEEHNRSHPRPAVQAPAMRRAISSSSASKSVARRTSSDKDGSSIVPPHLSLAMSPELERRSSEPQMGEKPLNARTTKPSSHIKLLPSEQAAEVPSQHFSTLRDNVLSYLTSHSRMALGERTVCIMTPRVAQKSYGTEKRFMCPPPMVLLVGSSWWNASISCDGQDEEQDKRTILIPPRVSTKILGEAAAFETQLDWTSRDGQNISIGSSYNDMTVLGQAAYRQMAISEADDKLTRRDVTAEVAITVPAVSAQQHKLLGRFKSRPIRVISKPSKKRQSARGTEMHITHGSIVSLFHRQKAQATSTKHLCVSGPATWLKGSDGQSIMTAADGPQPSGACFVAKTSRWDAFIIYLIDPLRDPHGDSNAPRQPGYPSTPSNALPASTSPIFYNQPIVLQCLNTAVVSPVMIIRRVDKGNTIFGGKMVRGPDWKLAKEAVGDPVSQLHKIALEIWEPPSNEGTTSTTSSFLACSDETVGMHKLEVGKVWLNRSPSTASSNATDGAPATPPTTSAATDVDFEKASSSLAMIYPPASASKAPMVSPTLSGGGSSRMEKSESSDGGKVRRPRRVSSSLSLQAQKDRALHAAKGRKRGQSMSGAAEGLSSMLADAGPASAPYPTFDSGRDAEAWTLDVADSDIWCIVGAEIVKYTFYLPSELAGGVRPPTGPLDAQISRLLTTPAPASPVTAFPKLHKISLARDQEKGDFLVLEGEKLNSNLHIFFGDWQSPAVQCLSSSKMYCLPPPSELNGAHRAPLPVLLVRQDGIIYPTPHII